MQELPVIDIGRWTVRGTGRDRVAVEIDRACRERGFFQITGHGVDASLSSKLQTAARRFFALPVERKMSISMERGGRAWRGYFPVGDELTSGRPDRKEGLYFGAELEDDHAMVRAGTPMHGRNLFPADVPELRILVLEYIAEMTRVGHLLMEAIATGLGLETSYFADRYTGDPLVLFRIFHYPPAPRGALDPGWGAGEHTDYGVLTILWQDSLGLQVKSRGQWVDVPPIPGALVCNLGDMLDRMTGGLYRSTPHRGVSPSERSRVSFPFFFDPNFNARIEPIDPGRSPDEDRDCRWDRSSVHAFKGTYGDYLLGKVSAVFPQLGRNVL